MDDKKIIQELGEYLAPIYFRSKFYKNEKISVHITTNEKRFYNGIIIEINENNLIIDDEKLGKVFLFLTEIKFIEPREAKR